MTVFFDFSGFSFGVDVFTVVGWMFWFFAGLSLARARERIIYQPEPSPGWREQLHRAGMDYLATYADVNPDEVSEVLEVTYDDLEALRERPAKEAKKPETFGELQAAAKFDKDAQVIDWNPEVRQRPNGGFATPEEYRRRMQEMGYQ